MEMIIQNETGNFTLHVRISDSKEYDFLKDVTELARKYDFENDDFIELEDPEEETDQVPETTIREVTEEYKGFYIFAAKNAEKQSHTMQKSQRHSTNARNVDT